MVYVEGQSITVNNCTFHMNLRTLEMLEIKEDCTPLQHREAIIQYNLLKPTCCCDNFESFTLQIPDRLHERPPSIGYGEHKDFIARHFKSLNDTMCVEDILGL